MHTMFRKISPIGLAVFALACTSAASITPASATVMNSRDCKISGICSSSGLEASGHSYLVVGLAQRPAASQADWNSRDWNSRDCRRYGICPTGE